MKNSNDTIENRNRDLPACSALPQPTALQRAPFSEEHFENSYTLVKSCLRIYVEHVSDNVYIPFSHIPLSLIPNIYSIVFEGNY